MVSLIETSNLRTFYSTFFNVKLADFGFATPISGRNGKAKSNSYIGTPGYMAPEILAKEPYQGTTTDMFALGVILFILKAGYPPFKVASMQDSLYKFIILNRSDLFWADHSNYAGPGFFSAEFKDLVTGLLQLNPNHRLSLPEVAGHPWVVNTVIATAS